MNSVKFCTNKDCKQVNPQPLDNFYGNRKTKDGLMYKCKYCVNETNKAYRKKPEAKLKEKVRKKSPKYKQYEKNYWYNNPNAKKRHKDKRLLRKYGISLEQYNIMLIEQNHKCKLCGIDEVNAGKKKLVIDHNHETEEIRGLICGPCNRALGYFKDSLEILRKAVDYLEKDNNKISNVIVLNKIMENK